MTGTGLTTLEASFRDRGIRAVELGRVADATGVHVGVLLPDTARIPRDWAHRAGFAGGRIFSPEGGTGRSFRLETTAQEITLALFPVDLAEELLNRAGQLSPEDRFRIRAYLTCYFGTLQRVLGLNGEEDRAEIDRLAQAVGETGAIFCDREALDTRLVGEGWRPTNDMIQRLSIADPWLRDVLLPRIAPRRGLAPGLAVYFLRERAEHLGFAETARQAIRQSGFEILAETGLAPERSEDLRRSTRGGNWRKGPFPESGGPPARLFFVADVFPYSPYARVQARHPLLDNGRTLACKERVRDAIFAQVPAERRFNPIHSTDTSDEAGEIAALVLGEGGQELERDFTRRVSRVHRLTQGQATSGRGGEVFAFVRHDDRLRKLYRPQYANRAGRAIAAHRTLGTADRRWMELCGGSVEDGYVDFKAPDPGASQLCRHPLPLPLWASEHLREMADATTQAGLHLDAGSFLDGLWISPKDRSLAVAGVETAPGPPGLSTDVPDRRWRKVAGMPRDVILSGGALKRRLWRRVIGPATDLARRARTGLRRVLGGLRRRLRR